MDSFAQAEYLDWVVRRTLDKWENWLVFDLMIHRCAVCAECNQIVIEVKYLSNEINEQYSSLIMT